MTDTSKVLKYLEQAAARAEAGDDTEPPAEAETIGYTRARLSEAAQFAHAGAEIPSGARLRPVKAAILTGLRPITSNQGEFNQHLLAAVDGLTAAAERIGREIVHQDQNMARVQAGIATTDLTIDDLATEIRQLGDTVEQLTEVVRQTARVDQTDELQATVRSLAGEMAALSAKQDLIFRVAREALPDEAHPAQLRELSRELDTGYEELYQDLEDTFRGTREHVRALTAEYLDDLTTVPGKGAVVDVGCGRGEWLEVLRDADIESYVVDTNQVVVDRCVARGLDARAEDALVHLRQLPESSLRAVTSFHLVEHLSLDTLIGLIEAALLALKPGGILILETPNPTNLNVGASSFYLDPTHIKPVHPQFLEFLLLARGYAEAEVRFLHSEDTERLEPEDLVSNDSDPARAQALVDKINWALAGPLDYAVIARKAHPVG
ncbi:MAG: methyltransferase domain-containing protein [Aquihabitans sp.]